MSGNQANIVISSRGFTLLGLTTLSFNIVDLNAATFNMINPYQTLLAMVLS
ncbi:hypothetical protein ymoll0001_27410 [Yersinia mollaretii ATCC 43969]|uniref:Uncharacterized protein n=1 Tax=Yersinia mollaretii (strain ATCC 43969 / DSM 18520 / CIP 103324 / CNY 7263 / WAIP 204) TaxID=349967 RepID=A0ABM9Y4Z3_YERMW|nr:hypothetical protein ymoll0001_27410 [Yersinia mollaretii ATCC 43969]